MTKKKAECRSILSTKNSTTEEGDVDPIVVQKRYRIHPHDTLEDVMARSKGIVLNDFGDLAAEAII